MFKKKISFQNIPAESETENAKKIMFHERRAESGLETNSISILNI